MNPGSSADQQRITSWVEDHARSVRGYIWALLRRGDLAEDLTQEVFRRAWQARATYREQGTPRAYLLRIADHLVRDWFRRPENAVRPETNSRPGAQIQLGADGWNGFEPESLDDSPERAAVQNEEEARLQQAMEQLSPVQQRVLLLRYYGEMGFVEIASTLEIPLNTALSHCHRGLEALRKMLGETVS